MLVDFAAEPDFMENPDFTAAALVSTARQERTPRQAATLARSVALITEELPEAFQHAASQASVGASMAVEVSMEAEASTAAAAIANSKQLPKRNRRPGEKKAGARTPWKHGSLHRRRKLALPYPTGFKKRRMVLRFRDRQAGDPVPQNRRKRGNRNSSM